jgi:hypothetical protein
MVAKALHLRIPVMNANLLWLMRELKLLPLIKAPFFMPTAILSLVHGFTRPREAHHRDLDQKALTAEILPL